MANGQVLGEPLYQIIQLMTSTATNAKLQVPLGEFIQPGAIRAPGFSALPSSSCRHGHSFDLFSPDLKITIIIASAFRATINCQKDQNKFGIQLRSPSSLNPLTSKFLQQF